jgi:hypothetical protein
MLLLLFCDFVSIYEITSINSIWIFGLKFCLFDFSVKEIINLSSQYVWLLGHNQLIPIVKLNFDTGYQKQKIKLWH